LVEEKGVQTQKEGRALLIEPSADTPLTLAILGRPNVGKSTLMNTLLGYRRMETGPEAGLTRDAMKVKGFLGKEPCFFVDTAGLKRRKALRDTPESLAEKDTLNALEFANVGVVVMDALAPLERQDLIIASTVWREGRTLVLVFNKKDALSNVKTWEAWMKKECPYRLPFATHVPWVLMSSLEKKGIKALEKAVFCAYKNWRKEVSKKDLNAWLERVQEIHPPPKAVGIRPKMKYIVQSKARPPTFRIFGNRLQFLAETYKSYLQNRLTETFDFKGSPVRLVFMKGDNPYDAKKN